MPPLLRDSSSDRSRFASRELERKVTRNHERENLCPIEAMVLGETVWFLKEAFFNPDIMSLDHAVQRFTVDTQHARCCLLVASRVRQDARAMASLNLSQ